MNYKVEFAKLSDIDDIKDLRHKNSRVMNPYEEALNDKKFML